MFGSIGSIKADFDVAFNLTPQIAMARAHTNTTKFPLTELTYMSRYHVVGVIFAGKDMYYELEGFKGKTVDSDYFLGSKNAIGCTICGEIMQIPAIGSKLGCLNLFGKLSKKMALIATSTVTDVVAISMDTIKVTLDTNGGIILYLHVIM